MKRKNFSKQISLFLAAALVLAGIPTGAESVMAAKKAKLSGKSMKLNVGQKKKITIKKKKKGAKYTFRSSAMKVARVSSKGMVTGVGTGVAKITVTEKYKVSGKKKTRKVGVVKVKVSKASEKISPTATSSPTPTTAVSEKTPTVMPTATPTATPTPDPNRDVYAVELFRVNLTDTKLETVNGNTCKVDMQYFKGSADGKYFSGSVYKESSDVKKTFTDGSITHCARYILSGKDDTGTSCKIFIQDEGAEKDGKVITKPVILTNSKSLAWIETADIQGRISTNSGGDRIITYLWNDSNTEKVSPPAVVRPDTSRDYTREIFTFFIDIGATDTVSGNGGKATMIHFGGRGECENFNGKVVADSVDTRLKYPGMVETLSARYILDGTDAKGNPCRVYVENNGIDSNGMVTEPIIITDCPDYAWIEEAPLHGTVSWENGLTIHMWTTQDGV